MSGPGYGRGPPASRAIIPAVVGSRWSRRLRALAVIGTLAVGGEGVAAVLALPAVLPPAQRGALQPIAEGADVSTSVAAEPFVARLEVFEYLLDHPDFASHVARALRLGRYRITRTSQGLYLDDGWGATGHFWVVYADGGTRVMRARGQYRKAPLPAIHGEAVTVIEYETRPAGEGRRVFHAKVTGFVKLDSRLLAGVMKLASAAAQRKADREAQRLMKVFARASAAIEADPEGVLARLREQPDVPRAELEEFARLVSPR